jgi:hypothetical protein
MKMFLQPKHVIHHNLVLRDFLKRLTLIMLSVFWVLSHSKLSYTDAFGSYLPECFLYISFML